jgi:dTDP-4-dehydrorhamnose reductase
MLGSCVIKQLQTHGFDVYGISRTASQFLAHDKQLIGDLCSVNFRKKIPFFVDPEIVISTAAFVNLKFCEEQKEITYQLHVEAVKDLANYFPIAKFVYVSTDSVFDGQRGNYTEEDLPNPLNFYAHTKYWGEKVVLQTSAYPIILRTNLYGSKPAIGNSLAEWALKEFINGQTVNGFDNVFFNPLFIQQIAEIIIGFIMSNKIIRGIYHVGSREAVNKFEFLEMLAKAFGFKVKINKTSMSQEGDVFKRPMNTILNTEKFFNNFGKYFTLRDGIRDFRLHNYLINVNS